MEYHITSTANAGIKADLRLKKASERRKTGFLTVEGLSECAMALQAGARIERLYICPNYFRNISEAEALEGFPKALYISPSVMKRLSYRQHPDAWFAVVSWRPAELSEIDVSRSRYYLVAAGIEKPGNIGAIIRSANAVGNCAVINAEGRTDLTNPNVVRASKGCLFTLPCAESSAHNCARWLAEQNIPIVIADPASDNTLWSTDLPRRLAIVLGAESEGVGDFWRERAQLSIQIPQRGEVNSLNVAQSATLILYELLRREEMRV